MIISATRRIFSIGCVLVIATGTGIAQGPPRPPAQSPASPPRPKPATTQTYTADQIRAGEARFASQCGFCADWAGGMGQSSQRQHELYARLRGPRKNVTVLATAFADLQITALAAMRPYS